MTGETWDRSRLAYWDQYSQQGRQKQSAQKLIAEQLLARLVAVGSSHLRGRRGSWEQSTSWPEFEGLGKTKKINDLAENIIGWKCYERISDVWIGGILPPGTGGLGS
jgi:hypothetical protein